MYAGSMYAETFKKLTEQRGARPPLSQLLSDIRAASSADVLWAYVDFGWIAHHTTGGREWVNAGAYAWERLKVLGKHTRHPLWKPTSEYTHTERAMVWLTRAVIPDVEALRPWLPRIHEVYDASKDEVTALLTQFGEKVTPLAHEIVTLMRFLHDGGVEASTNLLTVDMRGMSLTDAVGEHQDFDEGRQRLFGLSLIQQFSRAFKYAVGGYYLPHDGRHTSQYAYALASAMSGFLRRLAQVNGITHHILTGAVQGYFSYLEILDYFVDKQDLQALRQQTAHITDWVALLRGGVSPTRAGDTTLQFIVHCQWECGIAGRLAAQFERDDTEGRSLPNKVASVTRRGTNAFSSLSPIFDGRFIDPSLLEWAQVSEEQGATTALARTALREQRYADVAEHAKRLAHYPYVSISNNRLLGLMLYDPMAATEPLQPGLFVYMARIVAGQGGQTRTAHALYRHAVTLAVDEITGVWKEWLPHYVREMLFDADDVLGMRWASDTTPTDESEAGLDGAALFRMLAQETPEWQDAVVSAVIDRLPQPQQAKLVDLLGRWSYISPYLAKTIAAQAHPAVDTQADERGHACTAE